MGLVCAKRTSSGTYVKYPSKPVPAADTCDSAIMSIHPRALGYLAFAHRTERRRFDGRLAQLHAMIDSVAQVVRPIFGRRCAGTEIDDEFPWRDAEGNAKRAKPVDGLPERCRSWMWRIGHVEMVARPASPVKDNSHGKIVT
jgi:hypothetical protein